MAPDVWYNGSRTKGMNKMQEGMSDDDQGTEDRVADQGECRGTD